jgi:hypothetical protein
MNIATSARFMVAIAPDNIAPSGSRTTIPSSDYNAFVGMTLENTDDLRLVYRYGSEHNSPDGLIDSRVSTDLGVTWPGSGTTLITSSGSNDVRDPFILRLANGRLLLGYDHREPYNSSDIRAVVRYSDNDGGSWSSDYSLPTSYAGPLVSVVSGSVIQLGNGNVVVPGFAEDGGPEFCFTWTSTDNGATFASPVIVASHETRDYQEPVLRVLDSGRWLMLMRSESNYHTWRTYSDDAGSTWSTPDDVVDITGRPDFVEYRPGRLLLMGRHNTTGNSPLHYTVSRNDGATWTPPVPVDRDEDDLAMYSAPVVTSTGVVKVVYALESSSTVSGLYFRTFED